MRRRALGIVLVAATVLAASCSTLADYPSEWHDAGDSIHVYGSMPARTITLPPGGEMTLLDAVFSLGESRGDLSQVVVFRRTDSGTVRIDVDVRGMLVSGNTTRNILLRPGDVVGVIG
jgi:hypothetical protein